MKLVELINNAKTYNKSHINAQRYEAAYTIHAFDSFKVEACHNGRLMHPVSHEGVNVGAISHDELNIAIALIRARKLQELGLV